MSATVRFYALPGAMSTQEYPIMAPGQDISAYLIASVQDVKVTHDYLQAIGPMPTFTGYDKANIAEIDGRYYWIASFTTRTLYEEETVTFGLVYNAPTSQLRLGSSLKGVWSKTPTRTRPYMSLAVANDAMAASSHTDLPSMGYMTVGTKSLKIYWVECITAGSGSDDRMFRHGFFAFFDPVSMLPSKTAVKYEANKSFPTIDEAIAEPWTAFSGVQGDQIIQMAISERCPYKYETIPTDGIVRLVDVPVDSTVKVYRTISNPAFWPQELADPYTLSITLTDMERALGSIRIVNESGTTIATIPTQYGATINLSVRTLSDYTGMYTEITYNGRLLAMIPEGHLPWTGSAWQQYQSRQLEADRTMASLANQQARADLDISLRQSELNQVMSQINSLAATNVFSPGSFIAAGLGIVEADVRGSAERDAMQRRTAMEMTANDVKQRMTEKKIKAEPGTAYSMGYGTIYCINTVEHSARVQIEMPVNVTSAYFDDFVAEFGWPAEGVQTITLTAGYVQGKLINDGTVTGYAFDELQNVLSNGLKMKAIQ